MIQGAPARPNLYKCINVSERLTANWLSLLTYKELGIQVDAMGKQRGKRSQKRNFRALFAQFCCLADVQQMQLNVDKCKSNGFSLIFKKQKIGYRVGFAKVSTCLVLQHL